MEPEYRMPLILRYWEEYSYEEIATALELTISAVKSRLFRARKQMADLYRQHQAATIPPLSGQKADRPSGYGSDRAGGAPPMLQAVLANF